MRFTVRPRSGIALAAVAVLAGAGVTTGVHTFRAPAAATFSATESVSNPPPPALTVPTSVPRAAVATPRASTRPTATEGSPGSSTPTATAPTRTTPTTPRRPSTSSPSSSPRRTTAPASPTVLVDTSFNRIATGPMSLADYRRAMGDPGIHAGLPHTSIVPVPGRGNVIRQTLQPGGYGGGSGITATPLLPRSVDAASIEYDLRFDAHFDWSWGGKLPGLGGAKPGTVANTASGCNAGTANAWSGRGMWITPGSYGSVRGTNEWIGYRYSAGKKDACGDNVRTRKALTRGQWHTVKQYYKMNSVTGGTAHADGIHRMWLDGTLVLDDRSVRYRSDAGLHITHVFWSIFRGGNTPDWSSPTPGFIDIDNLRIAAG